MVVGLSDPLGDSVLYFYVAIGRWSDSDSIRFFSLVDGRVQDIWSPYIVVETCHAIRHIYCISIASESNESRLSARFAGMVKFLEKSIHWNFVDFFYNVAQS